MLTRTSFRFSPSGDYAACVTSTDPSTWYVERWSLRSPAPDSDGADDGAADALARPEAVPGLTPSGSQTRLLPLDDGAVLLHRPRIDRHEIVLGRPNDATHVVVAVPALGLQLLPHPADDVLALVITTQPDPSSTLWLLRVRSGALEPLLTIPGLVVGGTWLDRNAGRLAVNRAHQGRLSCVAIDLNTGSLAPLWPANPSLRLLLTDTTAGGGAETTLFVVADKSGRIGWAKAEGDEPQWPSDLQARHNPWPLAIDPAGEQIAVRLDHGARSGLLLYRRHTDSSVNLPLPAGTLGGTASWTSRGLRVPFSGPDHPAGIAEVAPGNVRMLVPPDDPASQQPTGELP
ncbi:hypothetical protein [Actinopolymorpha alba]|uniref:hypothetical protein n=1 Tax=Actinopolymorpha alba TaxID=533267 RepID=UPI00036B4496|nr:hypothetical protein [Actinopolymorpha alba]